MCNEAAAENEAATAKNRSVGNTRTQNPLGRRAFDARLKQIECRPATPSRRRPPLFETRKLGREQHRHALVADVRIWTGALLSTR
jgi:hypothetical protein